MIRLLIIGLLLTLCSFSINLNEEKIKSFHSEVEIQRDGSVLVTEKITVISLGEKIKKGIFRDIPLNFKLPTKEVRQRLDVLNVLRDGAEEEYRTKMISGGIRIYVGNSNYQLEEGLHSYQITYSLDRTVFQQDDIAKVLWNVNGNKWDFAIDTLSAIVKTPANTSILSYDAWTGSYGETDGKTFVSKVLNDSMMVFMSNELKAGSGLTFQVTFNDDVLFTQDSSKSLAYFLRDNALLIVALGGLLVAFVINFILWLNYGKDPKKGTIVHRFYPPENLSPAEMTFLLNEGKEDDNMFAAQLIHLAVKGCIKIEKRSTQSKKNQFIVTQVGSLHNLEGLTKLDRGFLKRLIPDGDDIVIKNVYSPFVSKANSYLIKTLNDKQKGKYFLRNNRLIVFQYIVPVIAVVLMMIFHKLYEGPAVIAMVSVALMIVMNIIFKRLFYKPTQLGRKVLDHILGFEQFIKYADELRISAVNKPDMNFDLFEKNLPYAIALGKADEWGKQFKAKDIEPGYSSSNYYVQGYSLHHLGYIAILSSTLRTASVAPSSTGGSSGGGFSGGGFSGGGAGGGGGGGW